MYIFFVILSSFLFAFQGDIRAEESVQQTNEYTIFGVYNNVFLLNGYEFVYNKKNLSFPLKAGDKYLVTHDEIEQLPEGSYRRKIDLTFLKDGTTQTFISTIMNDHPESPVTIAQLIVKNSELKKFSKPTIAGNYATWWGYEIAYDIVLKDGRKYTLTYLNQERHSLEEAEKAMSEALTVLAEGTQVTVNDGQHYGYIATERTPKRTYQIYINKKDSSATFWSQGPTSKLNRLTQTEHPVVSPESEWIDLKFKLTDELFNKTFQFKDYNFLKYKFPDFVRVHPSGAHVYVETKSEGEVDYHYIELYKLRLQYLRHYINKAKKDIFVFFEPDINCEIELIGLP